MVHPFHMLALRDMGMCIGELWFVETWPPTAPRRRLRDVPGAPALRYGWGGLTGEPDRHQIAVAPAMDELTRLALAGAAGDRVALDQFVRATQADVWRLCAHLGDRDRADDLTQETYLRAFRSLPSFRAESGARTWLLSIARRVVADALRTATRRRRLLSTVGIPNPTRGRLGRPDAR